MSFQLYLRSKSNDSKVLDIYFLPLWIVIFVLIISLGFIKSTRHTAVCHLEFILRYLKSCLENKLGDFYAILFVW